MSRARHLWIDASAGIAGDMLLAALIDAGADPAAVQRAVDTVVPGAVRITTATVTRAGLRAVKADVAVLVEDPPHRTWDTIEGMLGGHARARAVFRRLAEAEAHVHGIPPGEVHFHEVGALDALADVVGICAALDDLGVATVSAGEVALGSGTTRSAHGELPVPAPAVAHLARGWRVRGGGGRGEAATPTGLAVLRTLATACEDLPSLLVEAVGVGAGTRDTPGRANVVRAVIGTTTTPGHPATTPGHAAVLLEANVDDLDPRLWPGVLARLLEAGADDAWLVPILMKKGRPAHTLSVLCHPARADALRELVFEHTTTLGVREHSLRKHPLDRYFVDVPVAGGTIAVKVGHRDGVIVQVMPEFEQVAALARARDRPERQVLREAVAAAAEQGLVIGAGTTSPRPWARPGCPDPARTRRHPPPPDPGSPGSRPGTPPPGSRSPA
ncbi:nickel pincer cofactor biosynthesis protein LarC [Actinoplanes sp. RD1]|uniref:nickel pincer cofactor biosynthesis protein LarC n=1 Tax=Actinoplanes sp. RD1 TaxID=3064538 RepID=UPI002742603C|nr:nickel pincer cofactor biosynthesis protein LarC [Actinoplanes sp. RD1]